MENKRKEEYTNVIIVITFIILAIACCFADNI